MNKSDAVNHPAYYTKENVLQLECIDVIEVMVAELTGITSFLLGQVVKYCYRTGCKKEQGLSDKEKQIQDYEKALWYLEKLSQYTAIPRAHYRELEKRACIYSICLDKSDVEVKALSSIFTLLYYREEQYSEVAKKLQKLINQLKEQC